MFESEEIFEPEIIILGVLGNNNKITEHELQENILTPILQEVGRLPDKILLPSEGNTSIYLQEWAESLHIKIQAFQADWMKNGKIASIMRDERIIKESTHALIFLSQKSTRLEKLSEKLAKKGKVVFTSSHNQMLTKLELSNLEPSQTVKKASKLSHKLDKGKEQMLLKFQKTTKC